MSTSISTGMLRTLLRRAAMTSEQHKNVTVQMQTLLGCSDDRVVDSGSRKVPTARKDT